MRRLVLTRFGDAGAAIDGPRRHEEQRNERRSQHCDGDEDWSDGEEQAIGEQVQQDHRTDDSSGRTFRVQREYEALAVAPLNSVYTAFFSNELEDTDLAGLNCHVPDWRVPDSAAAAKRKKLDDLLIDL